MRNRYSKENDTNNAKEQDTDVPCSFRGGTSGGTEHMRKGEQDNLIWCLSVARPTALKKERKPDESF